MSAFKKQCTWENCDACFLSKKNFILSTAAIGRRKYEQRRMVAQVRCKTKDQAGVCNLFQPVTQFPIWKEEITPLTIPLINVID